MKLIQRVYRIEAHMGMLIPSYMRIWRIHYANDSIDYAIIPLCWILRGLWTLYTWSYRFRWNAYERELDAAYKNGLAHVRKT